METSTAVKTIMSGEKRPSNAKKPSSRNLRANPPPPPPRAKSERSTGSKGKGKTGGKKRENNSGGGGGGGGESRSVGGSKQSKAMTARSSRTSHSSATHHRTGRRSRSKSRPRGEGDLKESRSMRSMDSRKSSSGKRDDGRGGGGGRSRSKSRPRPSPPNSKSSRTPQDNNNGRPGPKKQRSQKQSPPKSKNRSASKSRNNGTRSGGGGGPKRQPSAKKRSNFASNARDAIPADVRMISGSRDSQTSADVGNINSQFQLPDPAGRSGGACTAALLQVLYRSHEQGEEGVLSWIDVLQRMRDVLDDRGFEQVPQLTSSRAVDVRDAFAITPEDGSFNRRDNTQRAVLIGINYVGQSGELSGCHNDVENVARYLSEVQGFRKENVTILMDDGRHKAPTRAAILNAYKRVVRESKEGDVVFCHYSGHGGRLPDDNGDEEDGYDETLIPVDYDKKGQIRDDDLLKILVHPMPKGVTMTCLMDCCHSGTVLDLPYRFASDGDSEEMEMNERCNFKDALWSGAGLAIGLAAGSAVVDGVAAVGGAVIDAATPAPEMMILGGGPNAIHEYSDTDCCAIS